MPLVKIYAPPMLPEDKLRALADAAHRGLVETCAVPEADRFQLIFRPAADDVFLDPTFPDVQRSAEATIVEILIIEGRTPDQKAALFRRVTDLAVAAGMRADDIMIGVTENAAVDWCAGGGSAYRPAAGA